MAHQTEQERLDELEDAIHAAQVGGIRKAVRGKSVEYDLDAMIKERNRLLASVNAHLPAHTYIRRGRF